MSEAMRELLETKAFRSGTHKKLKAFEAMIAEVRSKLDELSLGDLTTLLLEVTGYLASYKSSSEIDATDRVENIQEFIRATYEFKDTANISLPQFLDQVALVSDIDNLDQGKGAVPLMTVHLAKGLEFPVVFMVGMEEGLFPHSRSMDDDEELEEERRLCYVGMTRAKEKLHMTYCSRRRLMGREQYNLSSRFLDEIDVEFVEREFVISPSIMSSVIGSAKGGSEHVSEYAYDSDDYFDQRPDNERAGGKLLQLGMRVRHPVFGDGVIQKVEGPPDNQKVMIRFQTNQLKTIMAKYAQLEILSLISFKTSC
jgi:DNA helicase-2/ATP-dependent DNA helicase PcrA